MKRRVALVASLGAGLACLVLLAGCIVVQPKADGSWSISLFPPSSPTTVTGGSAGSAGTPGVSAGRGRQTSAYGSTMNPAMADKTLQSGAWQVVVEDTKSPAKLEDGAKPPPGTKFLVVDVAIRNIAGGNALRVVPSEFSFQDNRGKTVVPFPTKLSVYNAQEVQPIRPGMGGVASMVYAVVDPTAVHTFTISPDNSGGAPISWYVP